MLIRTPELGLALAKSLNGKAFVLMRGHGATVVGGSIQQAVYRAIYATMNACLQAEALRLGDVNYLLAEEAAKAEARNDMSVQRPWDLWKHEALSRRNRR